MCMHVVCVRYKVEVGVQKSVTVRAADGRLGGASGSTETINRLTIVEDRQVITIVMLAIVMMSAKQLSAVALISFHRFTPTLSGNI